MIKGEYKGLQPTIRNSKVKKSLFIGDIRAKDSNFSNFIARGDELPESMHVDITDSSLSGVLHCAPKLGPYEVIKTKSKQGAIIHGSRLNRCELGEYSTIDLTRAAGITLGPLSYLQSQTDLFNGTSGTKTFKYDDNGKEGLIHFSLTNPRFELRLQMNPDEVKQGIAIRKDLDKRYLNDILDGQQTHSDVPGASHISPYAKMEKGVYIGDFVVAVPGSYIGIGSDGGILGQGTNVQENCIVIGTTGQNCIHAHGAKVIDSNLGDSNFMMFNAVVRNVNTGDNVWVLPGITVDLSYNPRGQIPGNGLVVGNCYSQKDINRNFLTFDNFVRDHGPAVYDSLLYRFDHILDNNHKFSLDHKVIQYKQF